MTESERVFEGLQGLAHLASDLNGGFAPLQIVLLSGAMGVGKTELVRAICLVLSPGASNENAEDKISSPTFAVQNRYWKGRGAVDHVDLFRLESDEDVASTGFWEIFDDVIPPRLVLIEWPERINMGDLPKSWSITCVELSAVPGRPDARHARIKNLR